MITVHHLENSRSQRVIWLLEELGVEYTIKHYKRNRKTNLAPQELKDIHPLGKSPVITDDTAGDNITVAESGAIVEYLIETYAPKRLPKPGTEAHRRYRYWMHFAEGSVTATMVTQLIINATTKKPVPFFIRPVTKVVAGEIGKAYLNPTLKAQLSHMESELGEGEWFAGDSITGADIMMSFPCESAVANGYAAKYPNIAAFVKRLEARPAYQRALEKGGPYKLGG